MTKLREPDSIHDAVRQAMVLLGDDALANELGCSPQLLQAFSDSDDEREISGERMIKTDAYLVRRGFDPVFAALLVKLAHDACPMGQAEQATTPLSAVMSIAGTIGGALTTMAAAARDGAIEHGEIHGCLSATEALRTEVAKCRRSLFSALRRYAPVTPLAQPKSPTRRKARGRR